MNNPFHEGELKVQRLTGEEEKAQRNGQIIKDEILSGALGFIAKQTMAILGSVSKTNGKHWASIVSGNSGFFYADEPRVLTLNLNQTNVIKTDPVWQNIESGERLGILFIELETRRRLKVNGRIESHDASHIRIAVEESYPLCPKYIQRRKLDLTSDTKLCDSELSEGYLLEHKAKQIISRSDTAFLVTSHPARGLDVSHRGGKKGFLKVMSEDLIRCPDYSGNGMFNSFGNLDKNPESGLVVVDFKNALALQLTGTATMELNQKDEENETGGTSRFWKFKVESWKLQPLNLMQSEFLDYSPFLPSSE